MAIIDYEQRAATYEKLLLNDPKISDANKAKIKQFLVPYKKRVSPARLGVFCDKIRPMLLLSKDISKEMHDSDTINKMFSKIRDHYPNNASYSTITNVCKCFVRWLNDGEKPKGFKDISQPKQKESKRNLDEDDMIRWEEAKELIKKTSNLQTKTLFMLQLSAGLRTSELLDLNYGDISFDGQITNIKVRAGKTGKRDVPDYRSTPYIQRWIRQHRTKKATDPLWYDEKVLKTDKLKRLQYPAARKRFAVLAEKAGLKKPVDFYNLRHSSCFLDKLENYPTDFAADRHGHSVKFYSETYGRLGKKAKADRLKGLYGHNAKKTKQLQHTLCERCNFNNEEKNDYCEQCNYPLTEKARKETMDQKTNSENEISLLKKQMEEIKKTLKIMNK